MYNLQEIPRKQMSEDQIELNLRNLASDENGWTQLNLTGLSAQILGIIHTEP